MADNKPKRNPYIAGRSVEADDFFGRTDVIKFVTEHLNNPAIVLFGQRRIGKTSILLELALRLKKAGQHWPVYFDLMYCASKPMGTVLAEIARKICAAVHMPPMQDDLFDDNGNFFSKIFLGKVKKYIKQKNIVLLLDEFDNLEYRDTGTIPKNAAANSFFPFVQKLIVDEPKLRFVIVVGRKAEDMSAGIKNAFKTAAFKQVSVLNAEDAEYLVRRAQRQASLYFTDEAIARLFQLTAGHPYFTQLLCQHIWNRAYDAEPNHVPTITEYDVNAVIETSIAAGSLAFEWIWDGLPPAERVIFAAIAEATRERGFISEKELSSLLTDYKIGAVRTTEIRESASQLVRWDMLRNADSNDSYRFLIELMRLWVLTSKPLTLVKEEVYRFDPIADNSYQSANVLYNRGDHKQALELAQKAIAHNPAHYHALVLCADIYRDQRHYNEAIDLYRRAIKLDNSRLCDFFELLFDAAQQKEQDKLYDDAISLYEEILKNDANNVKAKDCRNTLLSHIATQADDKGDWRSAVKFHAKRGDLTKANLIVEERAKKQLWFDVLDGYRIIRENDLTNYGGWIKQEQIAQAEIKKERFRRWLLIISATLVILLILLLMIIKYFVTGNNPSKILLTDNAAMSMCSDAQKELEFRHLLSAINKAQLVLNQKNPLIAPETIQFANKILEQAKQQQTEQHDADLCNKLKELLAKVQQQGVDIVLSMSSDSGSRCISSADVNNAFMPVVAANLLMRAKKLRLQGNCSAFNDQMSEIIAIAPTDPAVVAAQKLSCVEKTISVAVTQAAKPAAKPEIKYINVPVPSPNAPIDDPDIVEALIRGAQSYYVDRQYGLALKASMQIAPKRRDEGIWSLIGVLACEVNDRKIALDAYHNLKNGNIRARLISSCRKNKIIIIP